MGGFVYSVGPNAHLLVKHSMLGIPVQTVDLLITRLYPKPFAKELHNNRTRPVHTKHHSVHDFDKADRTPYRSY
jgi:hypothetical protein